MSHLAQTSGRAGIEGSADFSSHCSPGMVGLSLWGLAVSGLCPLLSPASVFQPSCPCRAGRMLAELSPIPGRQDWPRALAEHGEHHSFKVSPWSFQVPLPSGTTVINSLSSVSAEQVKEESMLNIRGAAESPGLPELPSSPSAANGAHPCSGGGQKAVGTQWCLPRSAPCVLLQSLLPRSVLTRFFNKDNSSASCHFSSLSLRGEGHTSFHSGLAPCAP